MADNLETLSLKVNQQNQMMEQARVGMFNMELRIKLLLKMLEEKGVMAKGEFDKRWPLYLKNDVGVLGPDGVMEGSLKVTFYNDGGKAS